MPSRSAEEPRRGRVSPSDWIRRRSPNRPLQQRTDALLVIDAANVVGSRPDGWWRDRAAAARRLVERASVAIDAGLLSPPVVIVLEGIARSGHPQVSTGAVRVVHAPASGDAAMLSLIADRQVGTGRTSPVVLVSADRQLGAAARSLGADVRAPTWLLERLGR